jgi:hypothetical protein
MPTLRLVLFAPLLGPIVCAGSDAAAPSLWSRENIVAWCIVPFDANPRGPVERAQMLRGLGLRKLAYDYRDEHVPTFDAEVVAMRDHQIDMVAWWFPTTLDPTARTILATIERHGIRPQLWVSGWETAATAAMSADQRLAHETERIRVIAAEAKRLGCTVGLYNHGGWFGEPDHQVAIIERLRRDGITNVGIVYNFHHGHGHIATFAELWTRMQPHVLAVNLNGMIPDGDQHGQKIVYLSEGTEELAMMRVIDRSGWRGLVGVLNHRTDVDAEVGLRKNLAGLEKLAAMLRSESAEPGSN